MASQKFPQLSIFSAGVESSERLAGSPVIPNTGVVVVQDRAKAVREVHLNVSGLEAIVLAANDYGSIRLLDFDDKNIMLLSVELDLLATKAGGLIAGTDLDLAVGTAAASAQTLATTMIDVIERSDHDASEAVVPWQAHSADQATAAYPLQLLDSATLALYLNIGVPVGVADATLTFDGTVVIQYIDLGNAIS